MTTAVYEYAGVLHLHIDISATRVVDLQGCSGTRVLPPLWAHRAAAPVRRMLQKYKPHNKIFSYIPVRRLKVIDRLDKDHGQGVRSEYDDGEVSSLCRAVGSRG